MGPLLGEGGVGSLITVLAVTPSDDGVSDAVAGGWLASFDSVTAAMSLSSTASLEGVVSFSK